MNLNKLKKFKNTDTDTDTDTHTHTHAHIHTEKQCLLKTFKCSVWKARRTGKRLQNLPS